MSAATSASTSAVGRGSPTTDVLPLVKVSEPDFVDTEQISSSASRVHPMVSPSRCAAKPSVAVPSYAEASNTRPVTAAVAEEPPAAVATTSRVPSSDTLRLEVSPAAIAVKAADACPVADRLVRPSSAVALQAHRPALALTRTGRLPSMVTTGEVLSLLSSSLEQAMGTTAIAPIIRVIRTASPTLAVCWFRLPPNT